MFSTTEKRMIPLDSTEDKKFLKITDSGFVMNSNGNWFAPWLFVQTDKEI